MISKFTGIKRLNLLLKLILVYLQYAENLALFKSRGNQNGFLFFFSFFFPHRSILIAVLVIYVIMIVRTTIIIIIIV